MGVGDGGGVRNGKKDRVRDGFGVLLVMVFV
jgi:hypothetical protein